MGPEELQIIDKGTVDNSVIKRDLIKIYHQEGLRLKDSDQNIEFSFGKINDYQQTVNADLQYDVTIGNADLQCDKTIEKVSLPGNPGDPPNPPNLDFFDGDQTGSVIIALAHFFEEARMVTT